MGINAYVLYTNLSKENLTVPTFLHSHYNHYHDIKF